VFYSNIVQKKVEAPAVRSQILNRLLENPVENEARTTTTPQFMASEHLPTQSEESSKHKGMKFLSLDPRNRSLVKIHKNILRFNPQLLMKAKVMCKKIFIPENVTLIKVSRNDAQGQGPWRILIQASVQVSTTSNQGSVPERIPSSGLKIVEIKSANQLQPIDIAPESVETHPDVIETPQSSDVIEKPPSDVIETRPLLLVEQLDLLTEIEKEPVTLTAENIDPNCEIVKDKLICNSCNLGGMKPTHLFDHIKSKLHKLLFKYPQFRPKRLSCPPKLREGKLLCSMKVNCEPCYSSLYLSGWPFHEKSPAHKFYVQNPRPRIKRVTKCVKKNRPKYKRFNFNEDILVKDYCQLQRNSRKESLTCYICDYCRQKFYNKQKIESHVKMHCRSYGTLQCPLCDEIPFCKKRDLVHHARMAHKVNGFFHCKICNLKFKLLFTYLHHFKTLSHLRKAEEDQMDEEEKKASKRFTCLICNRKFSNGRIYEKHCDVCHSEIDKNEKEIELECKVCQEEFTNANDISIHYILNHRRETWTYGKKKHEQ
jgi:transcription elongation factor Elf1